jgi:hypothetical protein
MTTLTINGEPAIGTKAAAERLGLAPRSVTVYAWRGNIGTVVDGRRWFSEADIRQLAARNRRKRERD